MPASISRLYNFVDDKNNGVAISSSEMDAELNQLVNTMNQAAIVAATAPSSPINGQLWIDSTNKVLKQYRNNEWVGMGVVHVSTSAMATPQEGDLWYDSTNDVVNHYDGSVWQEVGTRSGEMKIWPTASAPYGYLICDGSAVSRTTYATLFGVISTTYGTGDGSTTFNLPDLRTRIPVGYKSGDSNFGTLAGTGGEATHTLITGEIPSHSHSLNTAGAAGTGLDNVNWLSGNNGNTPGSTGLTGGGGAHNNLQPYITLNFIIKT